MSAKLHIAMLSIHSSPVGDLGARDTGGMSVYVVELSRRLGRKGHRVDIFTARTLPEGRSVMCLAESVRVVSLGDVQEDSASEVDADTVGMTMIASAIESFRLVENMRYSLIHSNYWLSGLVGEQLAKTWNCPHVISFHTLASAKTDSFTGHQEHEHRLAAERDLIQSCTTVLAPTRTELQRLCSLNGKATKRITLLGCGVDLERFRPISGAVEHVQKTSARSSVDLLFVGRFDSMKGLPDLLQSLAMLARDNIDVKLGLIGGDGADSPARQSLVRHVEELELSENVVFYGQVPHGLLPAHYNETRAVVLSSHYESFGLVTLEALACGTPVAATRVGIAADVIIPGINGYLADPGEPKSLARAIISTLTLAAVTSPPGIRRTVREYGWQNVADKLENVYYNNLNTFHI